MNKNSYTYTPTILSYATYRYICDHCDWDTGNHEKLSRAVLMLKEHNGSHDPIKPQRVPPVAPWKKER